MLKLSFVVPIHRPDIALFEKVCKALAEQSLKDFETVFVLDGPCDEAKDVINRVMKKHEFNILEIEHGGAQKARNAGFVAATGDVLCFFDSDCIIEPDTAQAWMNIFERQPEIGFVYSGYRFLQEKGGISSEPFDPFMLRVRNYISTCFPVRREFYPGWDESLESLQDWSFWLSVVEKGAKGKFLPGYAFATAYPTPESISGKGCTAENWLARMDKVRALHNIPIKDTCVSALSNRVEGIRLAKLINADYMDYPNDKPNHYKKIIQVGFSLLPSRVGSHSSIFRDVGTKKFLFWTAENVADVNNCISQKALVQYSALLNPICRQFVEDLDAKRVMRRAGFNVEVMPMPIVNEDAIAPYPDKPRFLVDIAGDYGQLMGVVEKCLPDVALDVIGGVNKIEDYTGLIHFYPERTMTDTMKRMFVTGRRVISNVQVPFAGYVNDDQSLDSLVPAIVEKVRANIKHSNSQTAVSYYTKELAPARLLEVLA